MTISYTGPLDRAWKRMKWMLLAPFDLKKWALMGFTAWLAGLASSTSWKGPQTSARFEPDEWEGTATGAAETVREFLEGGAAAALVISLAVVVLAIYVLFLWLSSRGTFMFLDNLIHNRSNVKEPWRRYASLGDSLFAWRIAFSVICIAALAPFIVLVVIASLPMFLHEGAAAVSVAGYIGIGATFTVLLIVILYVDFFVLHCVAPLMYKHELRVTDAWRLFLPLLRERLGPFLLYGLFYALLSIGVGIFVVVFGIVTCCVGWLILAIPYVGTVLLLPVHVTLRGMDLEWLAQHGGDFDLVKEFATG